VRVVFHTIALRNFASFAGMHEFKLDRGPGLYFITGKNNVELSLTTNGCGKSTLFNSLYWVLTGKTLRQQRPGASIESWYDKGTVSVTLELTIDDEPYTIARTRKPNSLTVNGTVAEQIKIDKLIRLNEDTLKRTIIVGQFVPLFLELKAEQQSALFSEVLGLDLWLKAADTATSKAKRLEQEQASLELKRSGAKGRAFQLKLQFENEVEREGLFDAQKISKLAELESSIAELSTELSIATEAFQAACGTGNSRSLRGPAEDALAGQRALHAKSETLARSIATELRIADNTQANLEKRLARYQSSNNKCPECGQLVDQQHILTKINAVLFEIGQHAEILIKLRSDFNTAKNNVDASFDELMELERVYQSQREAFLDQQATHYEAKNRVATAKLKLDNATREFDRLKDAANPYTQTCETLAKEYCLLEEQISELGSEIDAAVELANTYRLWTTAYKEIRLNLIDETLAELELASNRHIEILGLENWRIEFKTERENKSGTVSHTFTTLIYPSGQSAPIAFESYSGGESQRLQLAVTAALSEILLSRASIDTNIEIYDESSKALSREGIVDLLECLKERAYELGRSIYFVDHTMLESGFFDSIITIEKNPGHGSRILV
jgi:DNA repair exonuclease SbcCD ATPase subunit